MPHKILLVGDVDGQIEAVFSKIASLHAKQNFAFAIIAGNLFSNPQTATTQESEQITKLIKGQVEVPLQTYFSLGTYGLPAAVIEKLEKDDGELCPNLYVLGRRVSIKTAEGFRIVAIGGKLQRSGDEPMSQFDASFSEADIQALMKEPKAADLLVTSEWPAAVMDGSRPSSEEKQATPIGNQSVADLCVALKPRYHFSTSASHYERDPFFHPGDRPQYVTRFLSLAPFGNPNRQKWAYAFSLEPSSEPPAALPEGCTASPFIRKRKRELDSQKDSYNSFRYSNGNSDHYESGHGRRKRHQRQPPATPDTCYFCLSNPACEAHMIGSIGEESYIAIAKGPLNTRETFPSLGIPGHMLLIPFQHAPTISRIPEKDAQEKTLTEITRYRDALHKMIAAKSKDTSTPLGAVTWSISRASGVHLHYQFLPVPQELITKGMVEAGFDVLAENMDYPKFAKTSSAIAEAERGDHFKVSIWSEVLTKEMVLPIDGSYRFDLQFGRKVLAKLLHLEGRVDWRACAQVKAEEEKDAEGFKEVFKEFDFSLEE